MTTKPTLFRVLYAMHVPVDTRHMHEATPAAELEAALEAAREELCAGEGGRADHGMGAARLEP